MAGAATEEHDIIIIGAGLSGINAAHLFHEQLPHREFTILEGRESLGGTWNFFRYPGFRSDSNMTTFGLKWHPWPHRHKVASAVEIRAYLEDAARKDGIYDRIRCWHKVVGAEWQSDDDRWRLDVDVGVDGTAATTRKHLYANLVLNCSGYYSYEKAFEAVIPGIESFGGQVVHPQWWPEGLDYSGKRIVVVGSGATAITLVPELAKDAAHLTMLQRSPSYVSSIPLHNPVDDVLRAVLPASWANWIRWYKDTAWEVFVTQLMLNLPGLGRTILTQLAKAELPKHVDADVHFNPSYGPFQQRVCLCPDGDFFQALHRDNCEIVTDVIETVKPDGILLKSGRHIPADLIVTATGLYLQLMSGLVPLVDGREVHPGAHFTWRGCMLETLPNMIFVMGNVTSSWTPGADLQTRMAIRVIKEMEKKGATKVVPKMKHREGAVAKIAVDTSANYFVKASDRIPKVTGEGPCYGRTNIVQDTWALWFASMDEGLVYSGEKDKRV